MLTYIIRRLLLVIPTLIGATALVFIVIQLSPGSVTATLLASDGNMRPDERKAREEYLDRRYGLKKPIYVQYCRWLNKISPIGFATNPDGSTGMFRPKLPDFGDSFARGRPNSELIAESLPVSLLMQVVSIPLSYILAIGTGMYAAQRRGHLFDRVSGVTYLGLYAVPVIWAAVMLIGFLANAQYPHFKFFPTDGISSLEANDMPFFPVFASTGFERGYLLDRLWHLVLPVMCLSYGSLAFLSKLTRGAVLDTIRADFIRTARAKGLKESVILFRHAFRNSLIPLITVAARLLPALIAGSVVVETVFSINGMGKLFVEAVQQKDQELLLSLITIGVLLSIIGTLIADICNVIADPRVSYE